MCAALHHPHQWPASCVLCGLTLTSLLWLVASVRVLTVTNWTISRHTGHLSIYLAPTNSRAGKDSVTHNSHYRNINVSNLEGVYIIIRHYQIIIAISPVCLLPTPVNTCPRSRQCLTRCQHCGCFIWDIQVYFQIIRYLLQSVWLQFYKLIYYLSVPSVQF